MSAQTRNTNIAIFTRACWLGGFELSSVIRSCRKAGLSNEEIRQAVDIYIANTNALTFSGVIERGTHLDRRAS